MQYVYGLFKSVLRIKTVYKSPFSVEHVKMDDGHLPIK